MHTTQEWHGSAQMNMTMAGMAQNKASRQCDTSRRAHEQTVSDNLSMYNDLHGNLEQKVRTSHRLIDKLQRRAASLEQAIDQTKQSHAQLEAAHRAKDAPIELCKWRMEQRERRPLREQVRDVVELALEDEKAVLVDTQHKLSNAMKRTKGMISNLEAKLDEVRHDLAQKTQALSIDEMCLRTTQRSWQTVAERSHSSGFGSPAAGRLPSSARRSGSMGQQAALSESSKNEVSRQQEAVRLNHSAASREDAGRELREENAKVISRCQHAAEQAMAKSEKAMQERINENQSMRRRLEGEIRETHAKIDNTKTSIVETKSQIKALGEPIELGSTCQSWRKQRATREHITDPVSTKLYEQQAMLLRINEDLRGHHQAEKTALADLNERRDRLKEDLKDKTAALHIDLNCLTHEAAHSYGMPNTRLSKSKLTQAMKVDRGFVPMPSIVGSQQMPMTAR